MELYTKEQKNAYDMIAKTNTCFFLTGKAGTGKTTFLKKVQESIDKKFIVLAPTGIAALNAGGQTIHSFFRFSFGVIPPDEMGNISNEKMNVIKNIDSIIIDEISMVRCDIIDAIDRTLKYVRKSKAPFGGIQMIFVGDMFQLPPVVKHPDNEVLNYLYGDGGYYFYKAKALTSYNLPKIEFKKVYRQTDMQFIELLDKLRIGNISYSDLQIINNRVYLPRDEKDMRIILNCYVKDARDTNERKLAELPGEEIQYHAEYEGEYWRIKDEAEEVLRLKPGAQVLLIQNDSEKRWVNGTIGKIEKLSETAIYVTLENGKTYEIEKKVWEAIDYVYEKEKGTIEKRTIGKITQYPLRLAWAITIHKSQSLTFDKVMIDFGRGAFTEGQAYVALSRVRTLEGLSLANPLSRLSIKVSKEIIEFSKTFNDEEQIEMELIFGEC